MVEANYKAAEEYVFNILENELSSNLYFHDLNHTKDVLESAVLLASLENLEEESDGEFLLLKTGVLYHDTGFLKQYLKNEPIGASIARETLPRFGYDEKQIEIISDMIPPTQMPQKPETKLQKILCDADLDNLGREDFYFKTEQLRRELAQNGIHKTPREWYVGLISLLEEHEYFTNSAKDLRQKGKEKHLMEIKELLGIQN